MCTATQARNLATDLLSKIVEKKSARLGLPGNKERQIALDADHRTICRFGDEETDQDNLKTVKSNVKHLYTRALAAGKIASEN